FRVSISSSMINIVWTIMYLEITHKSLLIKYTIDYNGKMLFNIVEKTFGSFNKPVIVGVSGGPDSIALLNIMVELNLSPIAAHYNHKLREEADREAEYVREFARSLGVPFLEDSGDVQLFSREQGLSIEEAARILRYQYLFQAADDLGAGAVAVAHHADDQIETMLMNLLRGSGMKGLTGMEEKSLPTQWSETIPLFRPFLGVWKAQILEYIDEKQLSFHEDPSNAEVIFHRNKIRHELVPMLETITPGFKKRLLQTADILQADDSALNDLSDNAWESCLINQGTSYVRFAKDVFLKYPLALKRRLIRKALENLRPNFRELSYPQVERALEFLLDPKNKSTNWVAKVNLSQSPNKIVFSTWETDNVKDQFPQLIGQDNITCPIPGEVSLGNGWYFTVQLVEYSSNSYELTVFPKDDFLVWVDGDVFQREIVLKSRTEGDLISPLGMDGKSMKVTDLMINEKIPGAFRKQWPLITNDETILWIPGGRLGHKARITENSKSLLQLAFDKRKS
ncbi:MAG: tRNA lysidine(34) synthetase TilS, partial [Anaerolineales bacterium]|nr:tRNA lysidine(34) synthetase TilS [Anaerolineales bacterium]